MASVKTLLKGKVKIESPKRIFLEKGELAEIYNSSEPIRHIAYIEFPRGKTRGGHYHARQEYFYIIRGEMELEIADSDTKETKKVRIKEGDLISIAPKIAHRIKTLKAGHSIEFSNKLFKPEDTIKYIIWMK